MGHETSSITATVGTRMDAGNPPVRISVGNVVPAATTTAAITVEAVSRTAEASRPACERPVRRPDLAVRDAGQFRARYAITTR